MQGDKIYNFENNKKWNIMHFSLQDNMFWTVVCPRDSHDVPY